MQLLLELLDIINEAKGVSKTVRQRVYHADYMKTRDKPYRQYGRVRKKKKRRAET